MFGAELRRLCRDYFKYTYIMTHIGVQYFFYFKIFIYNCAINQPRYKIDIVVIEV